ncbi:linear amide C-N hydrolase [Haloferula sp.]|uniref:linear amide C-N hydrolase n=1 Tax=Haloferula sp. TaxID=2497595 RepID=UPI00329E1C24
MKPTYLKSLALHVCAIVTGMHAAEACTAITLRAEDGSYVQARTMEWGSFDLQSDLIIVPRGHKFTGVTPDGKPGHQWSATHGVFGINGLGRPDITDGMNEKGLAVSLLYLPGVAEYQPYDPAEADKAISPMQVGNWLLTTCASTAELREKLPTIKVVPVPEEAIGGIPAPMHFLVSDPTGETVVVEYTDKKLHIYDNPVGVMTNSPQFPWHLTNLANYLFLKQEAVGPVKVGDLELNPIGSGSGMLGLPGDFTPTSRFVRAVAYRNTVPELKNGGRAIEESFRILNNFDIPIGSMGAEEDPAVLGDTQWTTAMDTKALHYYYRTMHNHRIRVVDLNSIDFASGKLRTHPLDEAKEQDYERIDFK